MGYGNALEKAGATVHLYEEFGSYQGTWVAKVTYNGKTGWIISSYGSCSGCDSYQAECGYYCGDNAAEEARYNEKLAEFGKGYLEETMSQEEAELTATGMVRWGDPEILALIQKNRG